MAGCGPEQAALLGAAVLPLPLLLLPSLLLRGAAGVPPLVAPTLLPVLLTLLLEVGVVERGGVF